MITSPLRHADHPGRLDDRDINVTVCLDATFEPAETFTVNLSSPSNATIADGSGTGMIQNDDTAPASRSTTSPQQRAAPGNNVHLHRDPKRGDRHRDDGQLHDHPGTATAGVSCPGAFDYETKSGTATIAAGSTTTTITVTVCKDAVFEANETFTVDLSGPTNATISDGSGLGRINNDDTAPTLSINSVSTPEGNTGTTPFTFTVTQSAVSGLATTVNYTTNPGTATAGVTCPGAFDYENASGTATIPAGSTTTTITVNVCGDTTFEASETFTVTLSGPTNATIATGTGTGTIQNDDTAPTLSINDVSAAEGTGAGNSTFTFTVTQSAASGLATTVNYSTAPGTATGGATCPGANDYISQASTPRPSRPARRPRRST